MSFNIHHVKITKVFKFGEIWLTEIGKSCIRCALNRESNIRLKPSIKPNEDTDEKLSIYLSISRDNRPRWRRTLVHYIGI